MSIKETLLPISVDDNDRILFQNFSKEKKWSLAKLCRVAIKTIIFMELKVVNTYEAALTRALSLEKRGKREE